MTKIVLTKDAFNCELAYSLRELFIVVRIMAIGSQGAGKVAESLLHRLAGREGEKDTHTETEGQRQTESQTDKHTHTRIDLKPISNDTPNKAITSDPFQIVHQLGTKLTNA